MSYAERVPFEVTLGGGVRVAGYERTCTKRQVIADADPHGDDRQCLADMHKNKSIFIGASLSLYFLRVE